MATSFNAFSAPSALYEGFDTFQGHSRNTAPSGTSVLTGSTQAITSS